MVPIDKGASKFSPTGAGDCPSGLQDMSIIVQSVALSLCKSLHKLVHDTDRNDVNFRYQ